MSHHHHHDQAHSAEEALALLKYMIDHNEHHIEELKELSPAFEETVQDTISKAVDILAQGNDKLREALKEAEK